MFCTGLPLYCLIVASAEEVEPTIVSPVINCCCAEINILPLRKSSIRITEVAFDVWPVMVSPMVNLPSESSYTIWLPSWSKRYVVDSTSRRILSTWEVTISSPASRYS